MKPTAALLAMLTLYVALLLMSGCAATPKANASVSLAPPVLLIYNKPLESCRAFWSERVEPNHVAVLGYVDTLYGEPRFVSDRGTLVPFADMAHFTSRAYPGRPVDFIAVAFSGQRCELLCLPSSR